MSEIDHSARLRASYHLDRAPGVPMAVLSWVFFGLVLADVAGPADAPTAHGSIAPHSRSGPYS